MSVICRTRLKDVDLSKTQPSKYFVYMYWENPAKTEYRTTLTATYSHTFWLQSFGRSHKSLANAKNYVTVPFYFEFEGNFRVAFLRFSKTIFVNIRQLNTLRAVVSPSRTLRNERGETTAPQNNYNSNTIDILTDKSVFPKLFKI